MNILVLGMHRAGTSATAAVLREAGFDCGDTEGLLAAHPANPNGYLERRAVHDLNDRLLASLGWTWDSPDAEPLRPSPARDALVQEARDRVASDLSPRQPWVLKDPRISLLLPWWRQVLLDRFVAVVPIRPPVEVAWSLWVRDGLPLPLGGALWAAYHRHLAAGLDGLPVIVVDYPALTADPGPVVAELLAGLRRLGIEPPAAGGATASGAAIDPLLRRATQPDAASHAVAGSAAAMADAWACAPIRVHDRFHLPVPAAAPWEVALLEERRRVRDHHAIAEQSGRDLTRERHDHEATRRELRHAEDAIRALQEQLDDRPVAVAQPPTEATPPAAPEASPAADPEAAPPAAPEASPAADPEAAPAADPEAAPAAAPAADPAPPTGEQRSLPQPSARAGIRGALRRALRSVLVRARLRAGLPNPLFDGAWYRATYPDLRRARLGAWWHWRRHGWREGRDPNPWFSVRWYLAANPDVRTEGVDPLRHYLAHGWREGRVPGPTFDGPAYLRRYPDVAAAGIDPLLHFLRFGEREGRIATAPGHGRVGDG